MGGDAYGDDECSLMVSLWLWRGFVILNLVTR